MQTRYRSARNVPVGSALSRARVATAVSGLWAGLIALAAIGLAGLSARALAAEATVNPPNEYTVKAVFLYSFGRYVQWPEAAFASASEPFVIGILGEDAFDGALDEIAAKKTIQGRPIVVQRFAALPDYRPPCHILFVSRSVSADEQAALLGQNATQPVFIVGETPGYAERGANANFFVDGERIRFELNVQTARHAQLRMDAKLLSLGKAVSASQ